MSNAPIKVLWAVVPALVIALLLPSVALARPVLPDSSSSRVSSAPDYAAIQRMPT